MFGQKKTTNTPFGSIGASNTWGKTNNQGNNAFGTGNTFGQNQNKTGGLFSNNTGNGLFGNKVDEKQALINAATEMNQAVHAVLEKFQKSGQIKTAQDADNALKKILEGFYSCCKQGSN